jgi:hypothetical protein
MNKKRWLLLLLFIPCCSLAMEKGLPGSELTEAQKKKERKAEKKRRRLLRLRSRPEEGREPGGEVAREKGPGAKRERVPVLSPPTLKGCARDLIDLAKRTAGKLAPSSALRDVFKYDGTPSKLLNALGRQKRPREGAFSLGGHKRRKPMALCFDIPVVSKRPGLDGVVTLSKALFDFMMERRQESDLFEGISLELKCAYDLMRVTIEEGSPCREYLPEELGRAASIIRDLLLRQYMIEEIHSAVSFENQLKISGLDKSVRNDILFWESLVRRFTPGLKNENLSRLVLLDHIIRGNSEGGGHFISERPLGCTDEGSVVDDKFEPITNRDNGVVVLHRRFKGKLASEPKTQFPSGTSDEKVFEFAVLIGQSSDPYAENREYLTRDNCRCVLLEVETRLFVEIIDEASNSEGFGTIRSCYPVFSFTRWVSGQSSICLARVRGSFGDRELSLSSDGIVELVGDAQGCFDEKKLSESPIRYVLPNGNLIVDLAPILKRKQEDGTGNFWDGLPNSIVPKGIYVEIPKNR